MMRFRFKEKYPRGRRGSPAKGVVREERSQGSNPCFSAKQNGQANSLVRFVFRYLTTGIWTRALRKRHGASFLAADRRLLQSIKIFHTDCFAKGKNKSLFLRHKNPTIFVGFLLCFETGFCTTRSIVPPAAWTLARQADRKRREKQALAFAKIERSGHRKQMDTKCQMQSISAQAQFV